MSTDYCWKMTTRDWQRTPTYVRITSCLIVRRSSLSRKNWFHGLWTYRQSQVILKEKL